MARKKSKKQKIQMKGNPWIGLAVLCSLILVVYLNFFSGEKQSVEEIIEQARKFESEKNTKEAAVLYRKAAKRGDAGMQSWVGSWYEWGDYGDVDKDYEKAVEWYRKSAEQGNDSGQYLLGKMYFKGKGVSKDYSTAAALYLQSAKQGHPSALNELAVMHENGQGVEKNAILSNAFFLLAAQMGDVMAEKIVDEFDQKLTKEEIKSIEKFAEEFYKNATPAQIKAREKNIEEKKKFQKHMEELKKKNQ